MKRTFVRWQEEENREVSKGRNSHWLKILSARAVKQFESFFLFIL